MAPPGLTPAEALLVPSRALPIGLQLQHVLREFATLSTALFALLSSPSSSTSLPPSTVPIFEALAVVDSKLAALLVLTAEHQRRQRRIQELQRQNDEVERVWRAAATTLHDAVQSLRPLVLSGAADRLAMAQSAPREGSQLSPDVLLAYARLLAPFTSAPPTSIFSKEERALDYTTGRGLPDGAQPPFPLESAMRQGRLQFGRVGPGEELGETAEVGARKEEDKAERDAQEANTAARIAHERSRQELAKADAEADDFGFDLDLNPEM